MRVLVITQDDPLFLPAFFERFFDVGPEPVEIDHIVLQDAFGEPFHELVLRLLRFYGPVGFVRLGLRVIRIHLSDQLSDDDVTISSLARANGVPIRNVRSVNDPVFVEWARGRAPDVLLSVSAPEIFDDPLLEVPSQGAFNVHSGPLPEYRGMMPVFWQMLDGRDQVGITVHRMAREVDRGEAVARGSVPIRRQDTLSDAIRRAKLRGAELAVEALERVRSEDNPGERIQGEGFYRSFPTPEDVKRFREKGYRLQ